MSLEPSDAVVVEPLVCDVGCSPSHRRARRFLMAIVWALMVAIICLAGYCFWSSRA